MVRVVRFAGGLLFDRVMAGWDVVVHVTDHTDARPLQILGARAADLEQTLAAGGPRPQALAVDAELYGSDARVRQLVLDAVGQKLTEVRLWGEGCPVDLKSEAGSVCHRLSVAARAFKAQALVAAATAPADPIDYTEMFQSSQTSRWEIPAASQLQPAQSN
jgi:hypothetical protein